MYTSYANVKTITLAAPITVKKVTNQVRMEANISSYPGRCKMKFIYTDGTNQFSNEHSRWESSWATKTYNNPALDKLVTKIEVWIKNGANGNSSYEFYSKTENVYSHKLTELIHYLLNKLIFKTIYFVIGRVLVIVFTLQLHPPMDYV